MVPIDSYYISSPAIVLCVKSLADPRFPRRGGGAGGANSCDWGKNLLFGKVFAENCMKMKEIGPGRAEHPFAPPPPGSANENSHLKCGNSHE